MEEGMIVSGRYLIPDLTQDTLLESGSLYIKGDRIVDVGERTDLSAKYPHTKQVGGDDYLIIPGLIDSHQHGRGLSYVQRAGHLDNYLEIWLLRALSPIPTYFDTVLATMSLIENGVTCTLHSDSSFVPGRCEQEAIDRLRAYKDVGIRVAFALGIRDRNNYVYQDDQVFLTGLPRGLRKDVSKAFAPNFPSVSEYLGFFDRLREKYEDSNTTILMGAYTEAHCSDQALELIREKADQVKCGVHLHLLESMYQKEYLHQNIGKTAVRHLYDIGFLRKDTSCAHAVWVTQEDIDILSDTGVTVVHNPSSNLRLRSGIAPVRAMLDSGVDVALGMDCMSLNDDNDIFQEMRLCANLHNQPGIGRSHFYPGQVFGMATLAGAKATTFEEEIGTLEVGKKADVVLVRHEPITYPYLSHDVSLRDVLFYRGKGLFVDTVLVDGSIVMENREFTRISRESVAEELFSAASVTPDAEVLKRREVLGRMMSYVEDYYRNMTPTVKRPFYIFNSNDPQK